MSGQLSLAIARHMKKVVRALAFLSVFTGSISRAQYPYPPPFDGLPIVKAPAAVAYVITRKNPDEEEAEKKQAASAGTPSPSHGAADPIVQWTVVTDGTTTAVVCVARSGQRGEIWRSHGISVVRPPGAGAFFINRYERRFDPFAVEPGRYGYLHTGWIAASNFQQKTSFQGRPALEFVGVLADDPGSMNGTKTIAWVDFTTRMPIAVQEGDDIYTFQFLNPPTTPLTLPAGAVAVISDDEARIRTLTAVPPSP